MSTMNGLNKGDLMRTWRIACSAAVLALGLSAAAHADEWNKLTYLTFSGPVSMPGITLPAGTYRFSLMDPESGRRVIRVSDKDGSKNYGIFLSVSDQKMTPSGNPVVMFREMPTGSPQAIRAWFYPGETYGYEFVYPHDQAEKIARATHQPVLSMNEPAATTTEEDRVASMRGAAVGRIDENGRPVSADEHLKDSSTQRPSTTTASANATTASAQPTTAPKTTTAPRSNTAASSPAPDQSAASSTAVGTSGRARSRSLPRTASQMPFVALLSLLSIGGAAGVRVVRKALA
jgi:hypothetical protein